MLEVRDITKIYNAGAETEMKLFDHFSLTVEKGQFVSIVGGNGSGKTSLLNIICGSIPITAEIIMELTGRMVREKHLTAMMVTHNMRYAVTYGDRLLMMNRGHVVLDRAGEEKARTTAGELMEIFQRLGQS